MALLLQGAEFIGAKDRASICISGEYLADEADCAKYLDCSDFLIAPAIVDIHGDGFERHIAPRRGVLPEPGDGLFGLDAELLANGIGTAVLAQFISWEGSMRGPEFCNRFLASLKAREPFLRAQYFVQLRLERYFIEGYSLARDLLEANSSNYLVFNDHLPHEKLRQGKRPPRLTGQALKAGRNPERHLEMMQQLERDIPLAAAEENAMIEFCRKRGVKLGSHDDHNAEMRRDWRRRGVEIAEFPESREAIEEACASGSPVIMGAPNLVRGASHAGNVSAREMVAEGKVDALASDYFYPSLFRAALLLSEENILSLEQAWKLISAGPAGILGLEDRGSIQIGKRADLVFITRKPMHIAATMVGGRFAYVGPEVAELLLKTG